MKKSIYIIDQIAHCKQIITSNKEGACLVRKDGLTDVPRPELSFIRSRIDLFFNIYCENEVKTIGMVHHRASEISLEVFSLEMYDIFSGLDVAYDKECVMGYCNVNMLQSHKWNSGADYRNNSLLHGLYPFIFQPTHAASVYATLIDNIFTNDVNCVTRAALIISHVSDHFIFHSESEFSRIPSADCNYLS